jgi:GAF domain
MSKKGQNSSDFSAQAAQTAPDPQQLEQVLKQDPSPERFCAELAKVFHVRNTEVALLRLEESSLKFVFPSELAIVGSIPISSEAAIAAHTAISRQVELFNGFAKVKHARIFEMVKLSAEEPDPASHAPIQKLMTSPIVDGKGTVLGVLQISRKAFDVKSAGPDFTLDDLQHLEHAARVLSRAEFMHELTEN